MITSKQILNLLNESYFGNFLKVSLRDATFDFSKDPSKYRQWASEIETEMKSWRAHVLVDKNDNHKTVTISPYAVALPAGLDRHLIDLDKKFTLEYGE